jgi:hypothetical protein
VGGSDEAFFIYKHQKGSMSGCRRDDYHIIIGTTQIAAVAGEPVECDNKDHEAKRIVRSDEMAKHYMSCAKHMAGMKGELIDTKTALAGLKARIGEHVRRAREQPQSDPDHQPDPCAALRSKLDALASERDALASERDALASERGHPRRVEGAVASADLSRYIVQRFDSSIVSLRRFVGAVNQLSCGIAIDLVLQLHRCVVGMDEHGFRFGKGEDGAFAPLNEDTMFIARIEIDQGMVAFEVRLLTRNFYHKDDPPKALEAHQQKYLGYGGQGETWSPCSDLVRLFEIVRMYAARAIYPDTGTPINPEWACFLAKNPLPFLAQTERGDIKGVPRNTTSEGHRTFVRMGPEELRALCDNLHRRRAETYDREFYDRWQSSDEGKRVLSDLKRQSLGPAHPRQAQKADKRAKADADRRVKAADERAKAADERAKAADERAIDAEAEREVAAQEAEELKEKLKHAEDRVFVAETEVYHASLRLLASKLDKERGDVEFTYPVLAKALEKVTEKLQAVIGNGMPKADAVEDLVAWFDGFDQRKLEENNGYSWKSDFHKIRQRVLGENDPHPPAEQAGIDNTADDLSLSPSFDPTLFGAPTALFTSLPPSPPTAPVSNQEQSFFEDALSWLH